MPQPNYKTAPYAADDAVKLIRIREGIERQQAFLEARQHSRETGQPLQLPRGVIFTPIETLKPDEKYL